MYLETKEITFKINSIAGKLDVFVSRTEKYPNKTNSDQEGVLTSDSITYSRRDHGKLNGSYYITVKAISELIYTIEV